MTPIKSSNIAAAGVQPNGDLHIRFHSGVTYAYEGVPEHIASDLIFGPESAGKYFHRMIKQGPYDFRRLTDTA